MGRFTASQQITQIRGVSSLHWHHEPCPHNQNAATWLWFCVSKAILNHRHSQDLLRQNCGRSHASLVSLHVSSGNVLIAHNSNTDFQYICKTQQHTLRGRSDSFPSTIEKYSVHSAPWLYPFASLFLLPTIFLPLARLDPGYPPITDMAGCSSLTHLATKLSCPRDPTWGILYQDRVVEDRCSLCAMMSKTCSPTFWIPTHPASSISISNQFLIHWITNCCHKLDSIFL